VEGTAIDELTRRAFLLWAEREEFREALDRSLRELEALLGRRRCYVAFSGGKDSTCLLHLALQIDPEVTVFYWDHGPWLMPRWLHREILQNARRIGARNLVVRTGRALQHEWIRRRPLPWYRAFFKTLQEFKQEGRWEVALIALRAEEGVGRRIRTRNPPEDEAYPIAHWTWRDVWAYILSRGLPYLSVYDRYGPVVGWDKVRLVTFFDEEFQWTGGPILDGVLLPDFKHPRRRKI